MELILRKDVQDLGKVGDRVKVAKGFARNYLIPQGLAVLASEKMVMAIQREQVLEESRKARDIQKAKDLAKTLRKISCTIVKQVSEGDRLFGSVTPLDIVKSLESEGVHLDKKQIILDEPIKTLGIYPVKVKLTSEIESVLKVWIVK